MTWLEEGRALDAAILDSVSATQQDQQLALARMIGKFRQDDFPLVFLLRLPDQRNPASSLAVAEILYKPVSPARLYEALAAAIHRPESSPAHPASARPLTRQPGQPLRILLAEDDPANRSVIRLRLERLGYQAALAANGLQVVQMLETGAYDIIIMDLQMPEMDGLATTRYIREALPADCQPFIIALTADTRWETQTLLLGSGFNLFLQKPVQKEALAQALEQAAPRPPERAGQATGQAPEDVHIDEDVLNDLCQTVGSESPQAVEQILGLFFEHAPRLIENIEAAAAQQKPDRLRAELHALKGHCELYGAARLVRLCKSLESAIAAGEAVNLTHGVAEIQAEYSVVLANLTSRQARTRVK
jgi:CheY-like chemotaxis protein/HPt (histidine-containing phosphotransfer) domain-containing protein